VVLWGGAANPNKNRGGLATLDSHKGLVLATPDGPMGGMATPEGPRRWIGGALWGWSANHLFFSFNLFFKKKFERKKNGFFFLKKKIFLLAS
jgi:hypothetical protein